MDRIDRKLLRDILTEREEPVSVTIWGAPGIRIVNLRINGGQRRSPTRDARAIYTILVHCLPAETFNKLFRLIEAGG